MNVEPGVFSLAREIMSTPVVTVGPTTAIAEAVNLLVRERISGLPVVEGRDRLAGMLTEFDLLRAVRDLRLEGTVGELMSTDVVTVDEDCLLKDLIDRMIESRVRRVPVLRGGRVVGIISRHDLLFAGNVRQRILAELPEAELAGREGSG